MAKEYIRPDFKYWSEDELNSIEAKMSGGTGWRPNIYITSAQYDGSTITATYRVFDTITSDMDYRIGYQYAGDYNILTMYQMSRGISVNKTAGTYTITLAAPNRNCEIRICVGYTDGDNTKFLYSTEWSWIHLPKEKKLKTYTVKKIDEVICMVTIEGLSFVISKANLAMEIVVQAADIIGNVCNLFNARITPHFKEKNYFRITIYYEDMKLRIDIKEYQSKKAYNNGEPLIFKKTVSQDVQTFVGSNPKIL